MRRARLVSWATCTFVSWILLTTAVVSADKGSGSNVEPAGPLPIYGTNPGSSVLPQLAPVKIAYGWLWADQPTMADYVPNPAGQWNSAGQLNRVRRRGTGVYDVIFPELGGSGGGNAQVTAKGPGQELCVLNGWEAAGAHRLVRVLCFLQGTPVDTQFVVSFLAVSRPIAETAYVYNDTPDVYYPAYDTPPDYSSHIRAVYPAGDRYFLISDEPHAGPLLISYVGEEPGFCEASDLYDVACWNQARHRVFAMFSARVLVDNIPLPGLRELTFDYSGSRGAAAPVQSNEMGTAYNERGGLYRVEMPGGAGFGPSAVHVTGYDYTNGSPIFCKVADWLPGTVHVTVRVWCDRMSSITGFVLHHMSIVP